MNILVTGASRGIGYEIVRYLSRDSSDSLIAVSRNIAGLEDLKRHCPPNVEVVACDLSREEQVTALCGKLKEKYGSLDILINNAGSLVNKPFREISLDDFRMMYEVNVFAVAGLIQKLMPMLSAAPGAHVVNISSMGGVQGSMKFPGLAAYSSGKAALACLTECLAEEFRSTGISFNCLAIGAVQTEMLEKAFPGFQAPLKAEEMAKFIGDFAREANKYMNGKIIPVAKTTP